MTERQNVQKGVMAMVDDVTDRKREVIGRFVDLETAVASVCGQFAFSRAGLIGCQ